MINFIQVKKSGPKMLLYKSKVEISACVNNACYEL